VKNGHDLKRLNGPEKNVTLVLFMIKNGHIGN